jgi:hypothetical protein
VLLRRTMGGIPDLAQAITKLEAEPNEANLRILGREMNEAKGSMMSQGWILMLSQDLTPAANAHEVVAGAEEAIRTGQQWVRAASDASDARSVAAGPACHSQPVPGRVSGLTRGPPPSSFLPFRWRSEAARVHEGGSNQAAGVVGVSWPT